MQIECGRALQSAYVRCLLRFVVRFDRGERSARRRLNCFSSMSLNIYKNITKTISALKCFSLGGDLLPLVLGLVTDLRRLAVFGLIDLTGLRLFLAGSWLSPNRSTLRGLARGILSNFRIHAWQRARFEDCLASFVIS